MIRISCAKRNKNATIDILREQAYNQRKEVMYLIRYDKVLKMLELRGRNKQWLRDNGINPTQLNKLLDRGQKIGIENRLCQLLNCQPGDIMEYVPDQPMADNIPQKGGA